MKLRTRKKSNIWLDGIMGVVVGDALGVPVEFFRQEELTKNPVKKMLGYGTHNLPAGSWSDDSSMMLATLDSLRNGYDLRDIMDKFVEWYEKGKYTPYGIVFDIGLTCESAISDYRYGADVTACGMCGEYDNGNGSLMRIMPICLYMYEKQDCLWLVLLCGEKYFGQRRESFRKSSGRIIRRICIL